MICWCLFLLKFIKSKAWYPGIVFTHRKGFAFNGMWLHQVSSSHPIFQSLLSHMVWAVWCSCQLLIRSFHICRDIINTWLRAYISHNLPTPKNLISPCSKGKCFCQTFSLLSNLFTQRREVGKAKRREEMVSSFLYSLFIQVILAFPGTLFDAFLFLRWHHPLCKLLICS